MKPEPPPAVAAELPATLASIAVIAIIGLLSRRVGPGRSIGLGLAVAAVGMAGLAVAEGLPTYWGIAIALAVVRAQRRERPRWWLVAGLLVGVDLLDKVLVVVLLVALLGGIAIGGPRALLRSRWVWGGVAVAIVVGAPTVVYQLANGIPQLDVGAKVSEHNGGDVRVQMWWFLFLILGPPLTVVWVSGLVALWRRPQWRPVRFLAPAFPVLLLGVFAMGSQVYYPLGLVTVLYAAGCDPVVRWWRRARWRRPTAVVLVAVNVVVSSVLALPVVPVTAVGATPVPGINQLVADSVGWPRYVRQIRAVVDTLPVSPRPVVVASNYGEAGAMSRYAPHIPVFSGQNALWDQARPDDGATVVVFVGGQFDEARSWFATCEVAATLDNGVDVDNEEQGEPVAVCHDPVGGWAAVWPRVRHLD